MVMGGRMSPNTACPLSRRIHAVDAFEFTSSGRYVKMIFGCSTSFASIRVGVNHTTRSANKWPREMARRWIWCFRFTLRGALIAIACIGILLAFIVRWWTRPYALTASHPNGIRAVEEWERRTLSLNVVRVKTVRYYRNGVKRYEGSGIAPDARRYWSPAGDPISVDEYGDFLEADGLEGITNDQSGRPFESFLVVEWVVSRRRTTHSRRVRHPCRIALTFGQRPNIW